MSCVLFLRIRSGRLGWAWGRVGWCSVPALCRALGSRDLKRVTDATIKVECIYLVSGHVLHLASPGRSGTACELAALVALG